MKNFTEVLTQIDNEPSVYWSYRGVSVGRVLHYLYVICNLELEELFTVDLWNGKGTVTQNDDVIAVFDFDRGYPYFQFANESYNKRQEYYESLQQACTAQASSQSY